MGEFCMEAQLCPQSGIVSTEDLEIGFNFLIDSFSFSIGLGVVGGREREIIIKEFA